jgi:starch-binding outer membrane protein, SusD/RagB family
MKKIKRKFLILSSLAIIVVAVACSKKFLDKPPLGTLPPNLMQNEKGVQGLLIGAYSLVDGEGTPGDGFASGASNWILGGVTSDDAYKGSDPTDVGEAAPMEKWTSLTSTNGAIPQKWRVLYAGAQRCNLVLATMAIATDIPTAPVDVRAQIEAQARFLRAFYHFELKKVFNNIAYADENLTLENTDNTVDAWPKIEADLQFAVANLPDTWPGEPGRANSWAAKAMLAKVYMYWSPPTHYAQAYTLLTDVIDNGKTAGGSTYALNDHFFSNFNPAQKNSSESIFAAQTSVQDNSSVDWGGDPNGNYGDILNFPYTGGPGACCGFYNPSQSLANSYKTDATTGLPLADPYSGPAVSAESGTAYTGTLDPRIDWTMGRPNIPYLDWGLHPGLNWIRNPQNDGNKSPLKNVYAASQKDAYTDVGSAYWGPTELVANNVNIIRLSDVILWAAECEIEANDLTAALDHVNQIRSRMMDHPEAWVKTGAYDAAQAMYTSGANADNYKIGLYTSFANKDAATQAVRTERQLELAMEGQRFFDLVRWGIAEPTINAFILREKAERPLKADAHFTANKNEYMPIPQSEIDNLNADGVARLKQNQGY